MIAKGYGKTHIILLCVKIAHFHFAYEKVNETGGLQPSGGTRTDCFLKHVVEVNATDCLMSTFVVGDNLGMFPVKYFHFVLLFNSFYYLFHFICVSRILS